MNFYPKKMNLIKLKFINFAAGETPPKKTLEFFQKEAGWDKELVTRKPILLSPGSRIVWVKVMHGLSIIAIARLKIAPPEFCYLSNFLVMNAYREKGIGRQFLSNIEEYCVSFRIKLLVLEPTDESLMFYQNLSYAREPKLDGYLSKALPALVMTKKKNFMFEV